MEMSTHKNTPQHRTVVVSNSFSLYSFGARLRRAVDSSSSYSNSSSISSFRSFTLIEALPLFLCSVDWLIKTASVALALLQEIIPRVAQKIEGCPLCGQYAAPVTV